MLHPTDGMPFCKKRPGYLRGFEGYWFLFFLLLPILLPACATSNHLVDDKKSHLIQNVPFYPQQSYRCGPAALAAVLNYWHADLDPDRIAAELYSESAKGTLNLDMGLYAEKQGYQARQYTGSIEEIKRLVDSSRPIIVLIDYGFWIYQQNHFMVAVGYNESGIIVNSGQEHLKRISYSNFLKLWEKTNYWLLLITP